MAFFNNTCAHDLQLRRKKSLSRDKSYRPSVDAPIDERKSSSSQVASVNFWPEFSPKMSTDSSQAHRLPYGSKPSVSTKPFPPPLLIPVLPNDASELPTPASPRATVRRPAAFPSRLPSPPYVDLHRQISPAFSNQPPLCSPMPCHDTQRHATSEPLSAHLSPYLSARPADSSEPPLINDVASPISSPLPRPTSAASSPTARSFVSAPGSTPSSIRRVPVPPFDRSDFTLASGSGSGSTSNLSHDASKQPTTKKPHNILRKPSLTRRQQHEEEDHPSSPPVSDNDRKAKANSRKGKAKDHRPRSKSVMLSRPKGNSDTPVFEIVAPMPTQAIVDLTPAREVVMAYHQAQRLANGQELILGSGTVIAVGAPEESETGSSGKSHWIPPWAGAGKEGAGTETPDGKPTTFKTLSRKLSARLQPHPDRKMPSHSVNRRSLSGALEFFSVGASSSGRDPAAQKRSVTSPTTMTHPSDWPTPSRRPQSAGLKKGSDWPSADHNAAGDTVGNWATGRLGPPTKEEQEVSNTGRLWKIVKRFSSGNLKEKRVMMAETAPPVPPLPKEMLQKPTLVQEDLDEMPLRPSSPPAIQGGIMRYISSVPALNISRPKTQKAQRQEEAASPSSPRSNAGMAPRRWRSATTRSSSPSSSATTGIFPRSRCSSDSSYGESIPPIPGIPLAHVVNKSQVISTMETPRPRKSEDSARGGLLRRRKSQEGSSSPTGSATMPTFESSHPFNYFSSKKSKRGAPPRPPLPSAPWPVTESATLKAVNAQPRPPIPPRNPYRATMAGLTLRKQSMPEVKPATIVEPQRRPSTHRSSGTTRPRSVSDSDIMAEAQLNGAASPSMFMFRELSTAPRLLTEQEKNDKWEDLLRRSANAGGTLHVRPPAEGTGLGLWSDRSSLAMSLSDQASLRQS